ncbi:MAG: TIGR03118 family protein [Verrucomicrobia bacterium]|nr:MAG: TIGR03118 family protein [Verrucomicrobiota bacterium]
MRGLRRLIINVLLTLAATSFSLATARSDTYSWTNLQSDIPGVATHVDPNLVNPWGMAVSPNGTIWVSDNGTGVSTLYHQDGTAASLVVTIPTAARNKEGGNPTGVVFNGTPFFKVTKNGNSAPAFFIFVSEDGSISGWNPTLDQTHAIIAVDNGTNKGSKRAIYKGATLGVANGHNFLYATNFHTARVETYDENFQQVNPTGFADASPSLSHHARSDGGATLTHALLQNSPAINAGNPNFNPYSFNPHCLTINADLVFRVWWWASRYRVFRITTALRFQMGKYLPRQKPASETAAN